MSLEEAYKDLIFLLGSEQVRKNENNQQPYFVIKPTSTKHLSFLFSVAKKYNLHIGTKKAFFHINDVLKPKSEILVDLSQLNRILNVDTENLTVTVESGVNFGTLSNVLTSNGLQLGIEPLFSENVEVGEFIAQNGVGYGSLVNGSISNLVRDLEILLPDGSVIHAGFEDISSYATGYNLTNLFIGSGCSFGIITKATLDVFVKPERANTVVFSSSNVESIFDIVKEASRKASTISSAFIIDKAFVEKISVHLPEIHNEEFLGIVRLQGMKEIVEQETDLIKTLGNAFSQVGDKIWNFRFLSTLKETMGNIVLDEYIVPMNKNCEVYYALKNFSSECKVKPSYYSLQIAPKTSLVIFIFQIEDLNKIDHSKLRKDISSLGGTLYPGNLSAAISTRLFLKVRKLFDPSNLLDSRQGNRNGKNEVH
jgi:FAD/FMN-containing dehydrogenase